MEMRDAIELLYEFKSDVDKEDFSFESVFLSEQLDWSITFWRNALKRTLPVKKIKKNADLTAKIAAAKAYPITRLIESKQNMARCPFHSDGSPSLNLKNNFYYCHGCGEHGDTIDFVMKTQNKTFAEAIETIISYE